MIDRLRFTSLKLAAVTFSILVLELAVIRWMSQQIRVFAYLNNLLLIAAFLGMGTGLGLATRQTRLIRLALPLLTLLTALLAFSRPLHLADLSFPDISIALWGADGVIRGRTFLTTLLVIIALFLLVTAVFACCGNAAGVLFSQLPPLQAYSADLLGSLGGVVAMSLAAALSTSPPVWFALGCIPIVLITRRWVDVAATVAVVALAAYSIQGAQFSPYNRLDLFVQTTPAGPRVVLAANRDFHQFIFDLSDRAMQRSPNAELHQARATYDLPFRITARKERALVVGAGTGNDAAAALRAGFRHVTSVDIDPVILATGRALHPERPYSDNRAVTVVNDARNFLERYQGPPFDVVCYGLLDSHAMFSAMSTLRLDNYVYTREGLRAGWRTVAPGGVMAVTFQVWQGEWLADRIAASIEESTGVKPRTFGHEIRTFVVMKGGNVDEHLANIATPRSDVSLPGNVRFTTDDWPFLYLRPGVVPYGYIAVISAVLLIAGMATRFAYGGEVFARRTFDGVMFLMGAAFLLVETRGVTDLSLLFGSTWIVNSAVFGGVLLVALVANAVVARRDPRNITIWFAPLLASLLISFWMRPSLLLQLAYPAGGVIGGLINAAPIGFAAVIFSQLLRRSANAAAALGSNLLGAVVGGCLEYVSLYSGLRSVSLIALALYLGAYLVLQRRPRSPAATG
jgi:SAM-dependent methyltransferase